MHTQAQTPPSSRPTYSVQQRDRPWTGVTERRWPPQGLGKFCLRMQAVGSRPGRMGAWTGISPASPAGKSPWFSRLLGNGPGTPPQEARSCFSELGAPEVPAARSKHIMLLEAPLGQLRARLPPSRVLRACGPGPGTPRRVCPTQLEQWASSLKPRDGPVSSQLCKHTPDPPT